MSESQLLQKAPARKPAATAKPAPAGPPAHRAVQRAAAPPAWAAAPAGAPFALAGPVQAKVALGAPGDTWEREADQVAQRVTGGGTSPVRLSPVTPGALAPLQRAPAVEEEEEADEAVQRTSADEAADQAPVQPLRRVQRQPAAPVAEDGDAVQRRPSPEETEEDAPAPLQPLPVQRQAASVPEDEAPQDAAPAEAVQRAAGDAPPPEADEEPDGVAQRTRHPGAVGGGARLDARLRSPGAGSPLPPDVRARVEPVLGADLSGVRVHDDGQARAAAHSIHARAFTHGAGIWLGRGESAGDVGLMAHEAAHVVQQGAAGARQPAAAGDAVQGFIPDWILEELNDYARHIPGWTLFTVVIGYNPLLGEDVARTPINLLGGFMGLVPFGTAIFDALNEHGILQAAFDWVQAELDRLDLSLGRLERAIEAAWDEVSIANGFGENLAIVERHLRALYDDVVTFATSLVAHVMEMIRDAVVGVAEGLLAENRAWALIKKILGHDPLRDEDVEATPAEILEDFLVLIGKEQHLAQMRERGTVEETAAWIATQVEAFMGLLGELGGLIDRAWEAIQPENLPDLMASLQSLAADAGTFLQRVWDFASTVADKVLELIKNALLGWLAGFADDIPGFHLLTVILGRNPFTGEAVPRTATNLIRGFITLLPGGAGIYARLAETGTIARAAARIEGALETLGITWDGIVAVFTGIWNGLAIEDLLDPVGAFTRITDAFGEYLGRLFRFVGVVLREMISIVLEMMNFPSDLIGSIIGNAMQAIEDVKRDPVGFLLNMLAAVKKGFTSFFGNIATHLMGGLADWLFRGLRSAGLEPPADLSLGSVLDFVLQVLGITMDRIWEKLADRIGRPVVDRVRGAIDRLTGIWTFVKDVQERGVAAIWEHIQSQISGLWDMVLSRAQEWVMERVVNRAIQWIASLLDITGIMPVINSFVAFFNAIQSAIEYLRDILAIVNDYVSTIAAVARGEIDPGAARLEQGLANSIPVAIGFLAQQFGLGNIGEKIQEIVAGIRGYVDQALDWLLDRAVSMGRSVLASLGLAGADPASPPPETPEDGEFIHEYPEGGHTIKIRRDLRVFRFSDPVELTGTESREELVEVLKTLVTARAPTYPLDALGRAAGPSGHLQGVKAGEDRASLPPISSLPGGLSAYQAGDKRGHLIGDRFYGLPVAGNLVPMHLQLNNSTFKVYENAIAAAHKAEVDAGRPALVHFAVTPRYPKDDGADAASFRPATVDAVARLITLNTTRPISAHEHVIPGGTGLVNPPSGVSSFSINSADRGTMNAVFSPLTPDATLIIDLILQARPFRRPQEFVDVIMLRLESMRGVTDDRRHRLIDALSALEDRFLPPGP